ncbi:SDR family oxidoreductase [Silicimonas algicola]|uniref:NAD(P)-dependent dehydrogenase (Short-subunit alcohol dehydrogenase family) n=1 Tax=Silicimonas algicola TaxID=1826607 RepID=A0A316GEV6_9RHOB|nr:SDR family oxidoreductase [Silicimonas algicola]AZQ66421.1 SDR family oxidoreductase [Silicimonas algicola]PWK58755.1 NAD(P)-dependent dehydrogenase (short-subunit alcohol dehydrogenase family) [Silicimonas algicola]
MKTALVTGAARGIGLATTRLFLENGWQVSMIDRDEDELDRAAAPLDHVAAIPADVSDPDAALRLVAETLDRFGAIDALVNNAGVADFGPIEETTFERWRRVMATNLDGPFLVSQAATPALKRTKGAIVNIGTSKAAVIHLTLQQAVELGEYGIRVNAVAPGPVRTKLAMAVHTQDIIDAYHDALPLNRYGSEREIAEAIVFLCSDRASFITGQCLAADGGFEAAGIGLPALRK